MFKTILVPTDGSALSDKAIQAAVKLAKSCGASLVGLSVAEPFPFPPHAEAAAILDIQGYRDEMDAIAKQRLQAIADAAASQGVRFVGHVVESALPYEEIIRVATESQCDLILMASHGRKGLGALLIGSETQKVLAHSTIPVLVYR